MKEDFIMESTTQNMNTPTPAAQPVPTTQPQPTVAPIPVVMPAPTTPAPAANPAPATAPAPTVTPAPAATYPAGQNLTMPAAPVPAAQNQQKKEPAKLILNTQRILDDWKYERGKVLIFLMKFMKVMVILGAVALFIMGFIGVIGFNIAISFLEPVAFLTKNVNMSKIMLVVATFLTIWVSFANKMTPYFKAFSIAKWLKKNDVNPKEVMKIFLQCRREKQLTKYNHGKGGINAEKADLSQAAFILLNPDNKKSFSTQMVWALCFWFLISVCKILFVFALSGVVGGMCTHIQEIIQKTASFDFMKLVKYALDLLFLISLGVWIVLGITSAITITCIAHSRNKKQQKWVKTFMKEDMPSEEYYEE